MAFNPIRWRAGNGPSQLALRTSALGREHLRSPRFICKVRRYRRDQSGIKTDLHRRQGQGPV